MEMLPVFFRWNFKAIQDENALKCLIIYIFKLKWKHTCCKATVTIEECSFLEQIVISTFSLPLSLISDTGNSVKGSIQQR